jgi:hypothetical protein
MSLDITADTVLGLDKREAAEGQFAGAPAGAGAGAPAGGAPRSGGYDDTEIDELPF